MSEYASAWGRPRWHPDGRPAEARPRLRHHDDGHPAVEEGRVLRDGVSPACPERGVTDLTGDPVEAAFAQVRPDLRSAPPVGFEPTLPPPEGGALSPELRGLWAGTTIPVARPREETGARARWARRYPWAVTPEQLSAAIVAVLLAAWPLHDDRLRQRTFQLHVATADEHAQSVDDGIGEVAGGHRPRVSAWPPGPALVSPGGHRTPQVMYPFGAA